MLLSESGRKFEKNEVYIRNTTDVVYADCGIHTPLPREKFLKFNFALILFSLPVQPYDEGPDELKLFV